MRRVVDITFSLLGLVLLAPLLAAIAMAIKLGDGGPILFSQRRVGQFGRLFYMHKFRTMVRDAEKRGLPLTIGADRRITRVGRLLRKTKLDELPQLWNVALGQMTLVGPRPEVPRYVASYDKEQRRVLQLRPGITDPASLQYFDESALLAASADPERTYREQIMPDKIRLNLSCAGRRTFVTDLLIILRTLLRMFTPTAATSAANQRNTRRAA